MAKKPAARHFSLFWAGLGLLVAGLCLRFLWLPNAPDSAFDCDYSSNEMCSLGRALSYLFLFWIMNVVGSIMMIVAAFKLRKRQ